MGRLRVVLAGGFLAANPDSGGHWMVFLQYLLGLRALGHEVFWLELLTATGVPARDAELVRRFFRRMEEYGLRDRCAVFVQRAGGAEQSIDAGDVYGGSRERLEAIARSADVVWNFAAALRPPLLSLFRRRVLVDLDPGHLHVSALTWDMGIGAHDAFLTVGANIHGAGCEVPTLGVTWHAFLPFVHLPLWKSLPDPGVDAAVTSVTNWTWEELWLGERVLSVSKRDAYLPYLGLPRRCARPFELAVHLSDQDATGDRELLREHGWRLVHPDAVAASPAAYQRYLAGSRAELGCPKPIHRALRTGWFSDRSACYLASGRPVLFEDTGIADYLPAGKGLILFSDVEQAAEGVAAVDANWAAHSRAARAVAETHLDGARTLTALLEACA